MRRRLAVAGAGFALALAAVLGVAQSASAHDQLVQSDPADGATVSTLDAVTLTYSEALLGAGDQTADLVQVVGPDSRHYETACAAVDGAAVTVPVALGPAGVYVVDWRVVSADGHPVSGNYTFTYAPTSAADAAAGSNTSPCAAVAAQTGSAGGLDDNTAELVAGLSAGAVVIGILVVIVMVGLQARRRKAATPDAEPAEPVEPDDLRGGDGSADNGN